MIAKIWEHDWKHRISKHRTWHDKTKGQVTMTCQAQSERDVNVSSPAESKTRNVAPHSLPFQFLSSVNLHITDIRYTVSEAKCKYHISTYRYTEWWYAWYLIMFYDKIIVIVHISCCNKLWLLFYCPWWHHKIKYIKIWYYVSICVLCPQLIVSFRFILRVTSSRQFQNTSDTFTEQTVPMSSHVQPAALPRPCDQHVTFAKDVCGKQNIEKPCETMQKQHKNPLKAELCSNFRWQASFWKSNDSTMKSCRNVRLLFKPARKKLIC